MHVACAIKAAKRKTSTKEKRSKVNAAGVRAGRFIVILSKYYTRIERRKRQICALLCALLVFFFIPLFSLIHGCGILRRQIIDKTRYIIRSLLRIFERVYFCSINIHFFREKLYSLFFCRVRKKFVNKNWKRDWI